jgi:hypothetical protein
MRWWRSALAALALMVVVVGPAGASGLLELPRAPSPGGIGLRLVDVPSSASHDPRAQLYVVDHLAPGTVIHRRVEVSNTTDLPTQLDVYPAAATIEDGAFLGAAGRTANDVSTWTSVVPGTVDLAPGARSLVEVTVTVPADAAPGEQYGVVWAEARTSGAENGITQVNRVGIRLYVSVGPGGAPAADFTIGSLTAARADDGRPTVVAAVHNTGGRALDMSGTLELVAGPGGLRAGPYPASLGTTLAIGATEQVEIVLDERLPAGPWDAQITLHSGLAERTARATITFPAAGQAPPVATASPSRPGWVVPLAAGGVALVVAVGAALAMRRRRAPMEAVASTHG